jgi:ABC-type sugar transport system substrate-binding protein
VLVRNPQVKVVSNQAADWDAAKAKALTQTVLKQHLICAASSASGTAWTSAPPPPSRKPG